MSGASRTWVHLLLIASDSCPMISLTSWAGGVCQRLCDSF